MANFAGDWVHSPPGIVLPEWIDYNGHMNLAYYVMAFDHGLDAFLDNALGAGPSLSTSHNQGPFALQNHVHYLDELHEGEHFGCKYLLLDGDAKRLHVAGVMTRLAEDAPICVTEQVLINVDHATRRPVPYPSDIQDRIQDMLSAQADIPRPEQIGRPIGLRRR